MQRIQTSGLLIALLLSTLLVGCNDEKTKSVAEYLHDIDSARAAAKLYSNNPGKYKDSQDWINASEATGKVQFVNECFPKTTGDTPRFTTSNTDHACLDRKGYKR